MTPNTPVRNDPLWADIQAQPDNMRRVIAHLYGPERPAVAAAARFLDNGKPTAFIGMGSAAYLCMPAEAYLGAGGRFASTLYASEALYVRLPALRNANVVLNTRSGKTVELVKLAQALVDAGIPFVAITNEPDSPVARLAAHVVWSNTRKDDLVSINVVTAMMATTLLLAAEMLGQADALRPAFEALAVGLEDAVARATDQADALADLFEPIRPVYLLYRGASQGAAYCGRLVLEEVGRHPGVPFDVGDFRQGPIEVADGRFGAVIFVPDGALGRLSLGLAAQLAQRGRPDHGGGQRRAPVRLPAGSVPVSRGAAAGPAPPRAGGGSAATARLHAGGAAGLCAGHRTVHLQSNHVRDRDGGHVKRRDYDILTVGDMCVDLVVDLGRTEPQFGQAEQWIPDYTLEMGGSACIFACQAAKLGLRVAVVGRVGDDAFGRLALERLGESGVDTRHVQVEPGLKTGLGLALCRAAGRSRDPHLRRQHQRSVPRRSH